MGFSVFSKPSIDIIISKLVAANHPAFLGAEVSETGCAEPVGQGRDFKRIDNKLGER